MSSVPWLTLLIVIPAVGSLLVAVLPGPAEQAKRLAFGVSLVTLAVGIVAATQFDRSSPAQFQLAEQHAWIPQFGVNYALGVDGIALILILMSLVLTPVCLLAAWHDVEDEGDGGRRVKAYYGLLLSLVPFMVGVFSATDVFLFYILFEAMLVPIYFLIGRFGGPRRQYASMKFLLFGLAGGLVMLVAVIALYLQGPGGTDGFLISKLTGLSIDPTTERLLWLGFFVAFAIKAPMVPVHTWLPDAATEATPATATLLVGVLDKVGTFGMIRFCLQLFPEANAWATPVVVVLAVISVIYGALLAIGQTDMMRLIAFTSISHFGFIVLGIFALTNTSTAGAALYMLNHGFATAGLFLFAAMFIKRRGSKRIPDFGGWQRVTPGIAGAFLVAGLSTLALPGLSSFVSEFLVMVGAFGVFPAGTVIACLVIILASMYILLWYKRVMTGPKPEGLSHIKDWSVREKWVAAPLIGFFVVFGLFPKPALDVINPAVDKTLSYVQANPATLAEGSTK
ncbi:MAG: NADH-quinone oxidoreductase subunit M [Intrasporangium sp.]|uniref:NADH-quinone oxidoreductase subunit M n=1 Tax=Intrasporangium sp. TaxID=1925024 RepID=UPI0026492C65|nr:NADH-quinone oxidoreductase subunit M [Intrasporangium sp.]MDN5794641.1 NADH-quinone oxidoreductase subunit M [Intrasporangium sp.]